MIINIKGSLALAEMFKRMTPRQLDYSKQMLLFYIEVYTNNKAIKKPESVALGFQDLTDTFITQNIDSNPLAKNISCKKGCSHCCYLQVSCSREESILIQKYCEQENIAIDWDKLKLQSNKNVAEYEKMPLETKKCIFLSDDDLCKIYKHRPINCRKYFSSDKPKYCNSTYKKRQIEIFGTPKAEITWSAIINSTEIDSIADLLLKYDIRKYK